MTQNMHFTSIRKERAWGLTAQVLDDQRERDELFSMEVAGQSTPQGAKGRRDRL